MISSKEKIIEDKMKHQIDVKCSTCDDHIGLNEPFIKLLDNKYYRISPEHRNFRVTEDTVCVCMVCEFHENNL